MYRAATISRLARTSMRYMPRRTTTKTSRRSFFSSSDESILQPTLTPHEELLLDATAWFVAIALVYSPDHDYDNLDSQDMSDLQDEARNQRTNESSSSNKKGGER